MQNPQYQQLSSLFDKTKWRTKIDGLKQQCLIMSNVAYTKYYLIQTPKKVTNLQKFPHFSVQFIRKIVCY